MGIGLTIVRELLHRHGGTIALESAGEGQGSTFTVQLPIHAGPSDPARPLAPPGDPASSPPTDRASTEATEGASRGRSLRILVVDDNEDAADMLAFLLQTWGHDVVAVYDGEAALRVARTDPPGLVLLDIGMAGLDGYATAHRLRAMHPHASRMRMVALTGFGQPADVQRARDACFDHHLTKPADHAALREIIELASG